MGEKILHKLGLSSRTIPDWTDWSARVDSIKKPKKSIKVGIIGKYLDMGDYSVTDSYLSIHQALIHAGAELHIGIDIVWLDAKNFESTTADYAVLRELRGIIVPGGFGSSGVEGKINAIAYARTHNIPYLGLCYGMQLAAVEFARNVCGMTGAHSTEVNKQTPHPVIDILPLQKQLLEDNAYGGTMRLGSYNATVTKDSCVEKVYRAAQRIDMNEFISERHRHRYEINPAYVSTLESHGICFSGRYKRADGTELMEFLELPNHPFFIATQAHPEFNSRFGNPNPLFCGFVRACTQG
jgi:CTP synthase